MVTALTPNRGIIQPPTAPGYVVDGVVICGIGAGGIYGVGIRLASPFSLAAFAATSDPSLTVNPDSIFPATLSLRLGLK
ncbi:MAG: hypothetical protein ACYDHG_14140 [Desulfomonilaceae bacterium]